MHAFVFNHIALSVKDVGESIEFYQKVFHLEEIENTASESKTRWLSFGEGKQLHLIPRPTAEIKTNKAVHFVHCSRTVIQNFKCSWITSFNSVLPVSDPEIHCLFITIPIFKSHIKRWPNKWSINFVASRTVFSKQLLSLKSSFA